MQTGADNQGKSDESCLFEIFHFLFQTGKATSFTVPRVNCRENNHVTSTCQMEFFDKTSRKRIKTEQVSITINFYIFKIVQVSNFSLN